MLKVIVPKSSALHSGAFCFQQKRREANRMYAGYTTTNEQDRARWELMQKNAEKRAQAGTTTPQTNSDSKPSHA